MQTIEIKNAKIEIIVVDNEVTNIRIEGKNIDINNYIPLGKGKHDVKYNTLDYKLKHISKFADIQIINWS